MSASAAIVRRTAPASVALAALLLAGCPLTTEEIPGCSRDDDCDAGFACDEGSCERLGRPEGPLLLEVVPAESLGLAPATVIAAPEDERLAVSICPPSRLSGSIEPVVAEMEVLAESDLGLPGHRVRRSGFAEPGAYELRLPPGTWRLTFLGRELSGRRLPPTTAEVTLPPCEDQTLDVQLARASTEVELALVGEKELDSRPRCGATVQLFGCGSPDPSDADPLTCEPAGAALSQPVRVEPAPGEAECPTSVRLPIALGDTSRATRVRLAIRPIDPARPTLPDQDVICEVPAGGDVIPLACDADADGRIDVERSGAPPCDSAPDPDGAPAGTLPDSDCDGRAGEVEDDGVISLWTGPSAALLGQVRVRVVDERGRPIESDEVEAIFAEGTPRARAGASVTSGGSSSCLSSWPGQPGFDVAACSWGFQSGRPARFRSGPARAIEGQPGVFELALWPGTYAFRALPRAGSPYAIGRCATPSALVEPGGACREQTPICACSYVHSSDPERTDDDVSVPLDDVTIVLPAREALEGTVDSASGLAPIFDALIVATPRDHPSRTRTTRTSTRGRFELLLDPGTVYDVRLQPRGETGPWLGVRDVTSETERLDLRLPAPVRVVGTVTGRDASGARPIHPAAVRAWFCAGGCDAPGAALELRGETITRPDGSFRMLLPAGR